MSNLIYSGNRTVSSTSSFAADAQNAFSVVAGSYAGNIPGASLILTVLDAASAFISGISSTINITGIETKAVSYISPPCPMTPLQIM